MKYIRAGHTANGERVLVGQEIRLTKPETICYQIKVDKGRSVRIALYRARYSEGKDLNTGKVVPIDERDDLCDRKGKAEMIDITKGTRREEVSIINSAVESVDEATERARLEEKYGQVWDTTELQKDFEVRSFLAPSIHVNRRSDGVSGSLKFQHHPRFYFSFTPS